MDMDSEDQLEAGSYFTRLSHVAHAIVALAHCYLPVVLIEAAD